MKNFLTYGCSTFLVLIGAILAFLALYDLFHPETRNWLTLCVSALVGVAAFLGGTAIIEISNARVRRAGEAMARELLPQLAAAHGVVTARMLYEQTSLSTVNATRFLERLADQGALERVPHREHRVAYRLAASDADAAPKGD
jgi:hypothetical protein